MSALDRLHKKTRRIADQLLEPDEDVITVLLGKSKQALIVTGKRILIIKPGFMAGAGASARATSFPLEKIDTVNVYNGPGVSAIEVVPTGHPTAEGPDLRAAYQKPNWLPCDKALGASPIIAELRGFVRSGGRSRSARATLSGS